MDNREAVTRSATNPTPNVSTEPRAALTFDLRAANVVPVPPPMPDPEPTAVFDALLQTIRVLQTTLVNQSAAVTDAVLQTLARVGGGYAAEGRESSSRSNAAVLSPNAQPNPTRDQLERRRDRDREEIVRQILKLLRPADSIAAQTQYDSHVRAE